MISLTLPYPPTVNNLFANTANGRVKSFAYRHWRKLALDLIALGMRGQKPISGPYSITIIAERPDNRRRDLANLEKATSDSLVDGKVIDDDCDADEIIMRWSDRAPSKSAQIHVTVSAREAVVPRDASAADLTPGMNNLNSNPAAPSSRRQLSSQTEGSQ